MLKNPKVKTALIISYMVFLVFSFFYVRAVTKGQNLTIMDRSKKKDTIDVKPVSVILALDNSSNKVSFQERMQNINSVSDLLEKLRREKKVLYEKIDYAYGTEFDSVNGIYATKNQKWKIFYNGKDITYELQKTKLVNSGVYSLVYMQISDTTHNAVQQ